MQSLSMQSTWPVSRLSAPLLLLVLSLVSPCPSLSQQAGYQYVQSAEDGSGAVYLNLWGVLGGCGGGTSDELYVQFVSGSILGESTISPSQTETTYPNAALPSNCVHVSGRTLDSSGLGPLFLIPVNSEFWLLSNNVTSSSQPDSYVLTTVTHGPFDNPRVLVSQSLSLQPPLLVPLTGPSVGLLFNAGFEQTLTVNITDSSRDMLAGWTGNYTVMQYSTGASAAAGLPSQSSASQRQNVSLLPGGVGACGEAALLHQNCSASSLSQSSLPLTLGLDYSLTWQAACGAVDGADEPCSYSVTVTGPYSIVASTPTITAEFGQSAGTWQPAHGSSSHSPSMSPPTLQPQPTLSSHSTS